MAKRCPSEREDMAANHLHKPAKLRMGLGRSRVGFRGTTRMLSCQGGDVPEPASLHFDSRLIFQNYI